MLLCHHLLSYVISERKIRYRSEICQTPLASEAFFKSTCLTIASFSTPGNLLPMTYQQFWYEESIYPGIIFLAGIGQGYLPVQNYTLF